MYVHHMSYVYVMNMNFICSSYCENMEFIVIMGLCSTAYNHKTLFVTLWWHDICITLRWRGYFHHIATMRLCLTLFVTLWWQDICITLWRGGYVHHIVMFGNVCHIVTLGYVHHIATWGNIHHIVTMERCTTHYNIFFMFITLQGYYPHSDNIDIFITLWR